MRVMAVLSRCSKQQACTQGNVAGDGQEHVRLSPGLSKTRGEGTGPVIWLSCQLHIDDLNSVSTMLLRLSNLSTPMAG